MLNVLVTLSASKLTFANYDSDTHRGERACPCICRLHDPDARSYIQTAALSTPTLRPVNLFILTLLPPSTSLLLTRRLAALAYLIFHFLLLTVRATFYFLFCRIHQCPEYSNCFAVSVSDILLSSTERTRLM